MTVRLSGQTRPLNAPPLLSLAGALVGLAMLLPAAYLVVRAADVGPDAWRLLIQPSTFKIMSRSLILAASVTSFSFLIALPLAWLTVHSDLPGRRVWSVLVVLPLVIPSYVGAFTLIAALGPNGLITIIMRALLGIQSPLNIYGFSGATLALTMFAFPYVLLSVRAALTGLDPTLEDAARSLGDNGWQAFWRITLPHLRPSIASGGLLVALYTLSDFGAVSILRYTTFTRAIYIQYQASLNRSMAALLALVLVVVTFIILSIEGQAHGRAHQYRRSTQSRMRYRVRLGIWRWPALIFCSLVVLVSLGIPLGVITFWLIRGIEANEPIRLLLGAALRSLYASGLAAAVAVLVALPVAILVVRYSGRFNRLVERSSYTGYALPGIVIALSLVFFSANFVAPLYQTLYMLVIAYVIRFLPQALGTLRSSLLQVSPSLEEAARGLGRRPNRVALTITLPMIRPGLLTGAALVFLTAMKELPATLLLSPTGYDTLAVRVWSASEEGFYARAAAPALLLVLVSALSVGLILGPHRDTYHEAD